MLSPCKLRWTAASAVVLLCAGFACPASAKRGKHTGATHGANFVVHVKIDGLGSPPFIALAPSGIASDFKVEVTTINTGDRASKPSMTTLIVKSGALTRAYQWKVGALGTKNETDRADVHVVDVRKLQPDLGFTEVTASTNFHKPVPETDHGDNEKTKEIAVEPKEWTVSHWTTEEVAPSQGTDNVVSTEQGVVWRFQKYDAGFDYRAFGPVTDTPKKYPGCAPVTGSKTITQTPWANSVLKIDPDLKTYDAFVITSNNNFFANCAIAATTSIQIQVGFIDLSTDRVTTPKKEPDDPQLQGVDQMATPVGGTEAWAWTFDANVPK